MALWSRELEFVFVTLGIYSSYLFLGYAQESVYTKVTGKTDFTYSEFMVFTQCSVGALIASAGHWFFPPDKEATEVTSTPHPHTSGYERKKFIHAVVYMAAMVFTNTSLLFVSYPTQALAKSCKILPVMLSGLFVKQIKYHWLQYVSVLMITIGVLEFQLQGGKTGGQDTLLGLLLLGGALACDGGSGFLTEVVRHDYKPTSFQMMKYLNLYSTLFTALAVLTASLAYHPVPVWVYLLHNPGKCVHILSYGLASAVGQVFIFRAIVTFGTLTLAVITTTRKFFTVFLSIFLFSHSLSTAQWYCVALVLLGSTLDGASKYLVPAPKVKQ